MRLSQESAEVAYWRSGGYCVACGGLATDHHHVFYTQRYPDLADDPDNLISLCRGCHANHHSGMRRIPRRLCRHAERLADEQMLGWLDRRYGNL